MSTEIQKKSKTTGDIVLHGVESLVESGFQFPVGYSPENAAKAAILLLQDVKGKNGKPVLNGGCDSGSVKIAVFKMITQGLNPLKNQCYFIPYGDKLNCELSYFGVVSIAKRAGVKDIKANIIWEGDELNYTILDDGKFKILEHKQKFENIGKKILGAYATVTLPDGTTDTDLMSLEEIKKSWEMGGSKGNSKAHEKFDGEMCKKTVLKRAVKLFINSSDDSDLEGYQSPTELHVKDEIRNNANKQEIGFDEEEYQEAEEVKENNDDDENQRLMDEHLAKEAAQSTMTGPGF